jgi:hypothetical protein
MNNVINSVTSKNVSGPSGAEREREREREGWLVTHHLLPLLVFIKVFGEDYAQI